MQRVHEGLANRLVQRCLLKRKPPRQLDLVGLCAEASNLARKRCTDRPGNTPQCELGRNVTGKLLQDECPQHSHPQSAPELAAGVIPTCVLRCHSEMGKKGHRTKKLRIVFKLSQLVTK